mgnify:CR=1 FL=1
MKKIFGIKNCTNCRKAVKYYSENDFLFIDVRSSDFLESDINYLISIFGDELVNQKSKTWRELPQSCKSLGTKEIIMQFPVVMKRPVIINGPRNFLGWPKNSELC